MAPTARPAEGSRPPEASRARRPEPHARRPRSLTRIAILACIGVMLALTLLPTLRSYLRQEAQISELHALVAQQRDDVAALQREQAQWTDPAYVEQQARERLKLVRPGERSYTVIQGGTAPSDGAAAVASAPTGVGPGSSWYARLWQSMVLADSVEDASATGSRAAPWADDGWRRRDR